MPQLEKKRLSLFGERLRQFRKRRGMSQLDLALEANSTARYVSFIETGRSRPGRDISLRLATALDLSLRESNTLLESAGLKPEYQESGIAKSLPKPAGLIIEKVLQKHEPYPAWVIGPGLRFLDSNEAAEKIFPGLVGMDPSALVDLFCSPSNNPDEAVRQTIVRQTISALKHEQFHYPHPDLPALLERARSYYTKRNSEPEPLEGPFACGTLSINGKTAKTVSTVMRFDKANDVTVSEIRIELVFPADEESDLLLKGFSEPSG
ncbi:helix-turn-helix transcriptional regulator [Puniceicoccaceae bacterium K14]|nr:helix-turn-helix transcriptional regulator [Puniceicoccaceae bacterium K14]